MTLPIGITPPAAATGAAAAQPGSSTAKADKAGEGFERMLLGQLTQVLIDSALPEDEASSAVTNAYRNQLPDALTEALMSGGGIGLAATLKEAGK
jgi:Rod binding domain-containing protein